MENLFFQTRHIPQEHLNFQEEMGRHVRENGLCDVLTEENAEQMRKCGVEYVETRWGWCFLEKPPENLLGQEWIGMQRGSNASE